jgi:multiple antibiotic resistance protein
MPVLIGPGTISASIVIGERHDPLYACAAVVAATALSIGIMFALKFLHDYVRPRYEPLVTRYIEIAGRILALYIGTVSVEMIMNGVTTWTRSF